MKKGDASTVRGVLAMLSVFRVLKVPSILKLGTITDPFRGIYDSIPSREMINVFYDIGVNRFKVKDPIVLVRPNTAGPNGKPAVLNYHFDVLAWSVHPLLPVLKEYLTLWEGLNSPFWELLQSEISWQVSNLTSLGYTLKVGEQVKIDSVPPKVLFLGRLSVKEEAAGKARVFAITDCITQSVLKPLHEQLFNILRTMPTDGTFDQGAPLDRLLSLYREGVLGSHSFHSYDLSAATDRLPIKLQQGVLGLYVGTGLANL